MRILHLFKADLAAWIALSVLAMSSSRYACAQLELIIVDRPLHARHLAGIVSDPTGAPMSGVQVDLCRQQSVGSGRGDCDEDPANVLATTMTDARGHFEFREPIGKKTAHLHLSSRGFDPLEVRVDHALFARVEVRIKLRVAN